MARQITKPGLSAAQHAALDHTGIPGAGGEETFTQEVHDLEDHSGLPGVPAAEVFDQTAHDAEDHSAIPGVPDISGLLDETAHDALDHTGLTGIISMPFSENFKNLALFIGGILTDGITVTPPQFFTERVEHQATKYISYFADKPCYSVNIANATLSDSTQYKHAFLLLLLPSGVAPIEYISSNFIYEADTSVDAPAPADIQDNDILIAAVIVRQDSGLPTITPPAGWTSIGSQGFSGGREKIEIFWKRCSSESGNYTFSQNGTGTTRTFVSIVAYRNCKTSGIPYDGFSNTVYTSFNTTLQAAPAILA